MLWNTSQVGSSCIAIRPEMPFIMHSHCIYTSIIVIPRFNLVDVFKNFEIEKEKDNVTVKVHLTQRSKTKDWIEIKQKLLKSGDHMALFNENVR